MNPKGRRGVAAAGVLLICVLTACGGSGGQMKQVNSNSQAGSAIQEEEDVVLTDRQKDILKEEGVSENYDELTYSQKSGIMAIEEMLSYVEEKYGKAFCYAGYIGAGNPEEESLTAYPAEGDPAEDCFEVIREGEGFTDDYMNVVVRDKTEQLIREYVMEADGGAKAKVYAEVSSTAITDLNFTEEDIPGNVNASCMIFVDGAGMNTEEAEKLPQKIQKWLGEQKIYGINQLIVLKAGCIDHVTSSNYSDYLSKDFYSLREDCDVQQGD